MKNILIYTNPEKKFDQETEFLVKVQIDNSLAFGWKDILLFTNFEYEYRGIKATVVPNLFCDFDKTANKILVINYLLQNDMLADDTYWYHDFDAFQNGEIAVDLQKELGLISYIYKEEFNCGVFFFKPSAKDIFELWAKRIFIRPRSRVDEKVMTKMVDRKLFDTDRVQVLNPTYNLTKRFADYVARRAEKPIKVVHFHPNDSDYQTGESTMSIFSPYMSNELRNIFNKYEIK